MIKIALVCLLKWFSHLIGAILGNLVVGIYGLARGKEPEGQLGFMYDMFHKNGDQPEFVATFDRLQHDVCLGSDSPSYGLNSTIFWKYLLVLRSLT